MRLGMTLDATMTADARYRADMELSSATMLSVLHGEMRAPPGLLWQLSSGGKGDRHLYTPQLARLAERDRMAETQRTFRDPCPMCAVRADVGCSHRRAA